MWFVLLLITSVCSTSLVDVNEELKWINNAIKNKHYNTSIEFEVCIVALDEVTTQLTTNLKQGMFNNFVDNIKDKITNNTKIDEWLDHIKDVVNPNATSALENVNILIKDVINKTKETFESFKNYTEQFTEESSSISSEESSSEEDKFDDIFEMFRNVIDDLTIEIIPAIKYFDKFTTDVANKIRTNLFVDTYLFDRQLHHKFTPESFTYDHFDDKYFKVFKQYYDDATPIVEDYVIPTELECALNSTSTWNFIGAEVCDTINFDHFRERSVLKTSDNVMDDLLKIIDKFNALDNCFEKIPEQPKPSKPHNNRNSATTIAIGLITMFLLLF